MKLEYVKLNPSGNTTIIVDNRENMLRREQYAELATKLMGMESLCAEQVGYMESPTMPGALMRLHMMGGEFCGNATRCFAKFICDLDLPGIDWNEGHTECIVPVEISGYPHVLEEKVMDYCEESARVYGGMPLPVKIEKGQLKGVTGPVTFVHFEGILHMILENVEFSEKLGKELMDNIIEEKPELEAAGLMFYDSERSYMWPAAYVRETGTLVFESSCGSGSIAVAAAVCDQTSQNVDKLAVHQPGGTLEVSFGSREGRQYAVLGGLISLVSKGTVWV